MYWADPSGADAVPITVMDLFNATENGSNASFEFSNGRMISANLAGELASFISEQLQAMYEMQPLEGNDHEVNKGNGGGNGGGKGTKLQGGPFDGQNSGNIAIYNDFFVFYLDKRHVTQLSHMEAFELFENFFKSRQQMFEKVMFWGDKSGYLPMANFKSLMRELGKANPTRLSAQALLEYANWKTSDVSSQNESIFRSYLGLHVDNPADMKGVIQIYERTEVLIYQSITVHYYDVATGSYLGKVN